MEFRAETKNVTLCKSGNTADIINANVNISACYFVQNNSYCVRIIISDEHKPLMGAEYYANNINHLMNLYEYYKSSVYSSIRNNTDINWLLSHGFIKFK